MKKKIIWLILSSLMVISLVLASCAPAEAPEEKPATPTEKPAAPAKEKPVGEEKEVAPTPEGPRYGGVFVQPLASGPLRFDEYFGSISGAPNMALTNETLLMADWAKGPAGTGEASWFYLMMPSFATLTGCLAESWELAGADTVIFHIRKGVHWHNKPPVNGREMTAYDVAFALNRLWDSPISSQATGYKKATFIESMEATDKWTFVVKAKEGKLGGMFEKLTHLSRVHAPQEAVEKYGDLNDWKNSIGTGPFLLADYIPESALIFERNPNYWSKDPVHPENQVPYLDGVKWLIIPDASTRMAAMRTAKLDSLCDYHGRLDWEDAASLIATNPELKYARYPMGYAQTLHWRVDKPELPGYDIKVRRALSMAVDNQAILDAYYGGQGDLVTFPAGELAEMKDLYTPLEKHSESIREQFEYHPEKAKQLLAEAGYPDGFKTEVVCTAAAVDLLSIVKDYWAKIGVELDIQVKEAGVFTSIYSKATYKDMIASSMSGTYPWLFSHVRPGSYWNYSQLDDPVINDIDKRCTELYFDEPKKFQIFREEFVPHYLEQAYCIQFPGAVAYNFWQPWVKGYHGENRMGMYHFSDISKYIWLDLDLKEKMIGRR